MVVNKSYYYILSYCYISHQLPNGKRCYLIDDYKIMIRLQNKILLINNRRTSMRLCSEEWNALGDVCLKENIHRNKLIEQLDTLKSENIGLTSLTRLFLLMYYKSLATTSQKQTAENNLYLSVIEKIKLAGITQIK